MAAKRKPARREAGQRKLNLLTGLAGLDGGSCRSSAVTELEDSDPVSSAAASSNLGLYF